MPPMSELVNFAFFMGCHVLSASPGTSLWLLCLLCVLTRVSAEDTD